MNGSQQPRAHALVPSFLFVLLLAWESPPAEAQALGSDTASAIVITASRMEQPLDDALPSTTVITREQIDRTQSRDLVELLGRQTGVEVVRSGGQGSQSSIYLRGTKYNDVLVLIDGVPLNSAVDGSAFLSSLSTDNIERIEIARGELSSLYGSQAIGGVIQIFTRSASQQGARLIAEAGQGRTRDADTSIALPLAGGFVNVSAGLRSQDAISAINPSEAPANPDRNANRGRNEALRWSRRGSDGAVSAWLWDNHSDTSFDDPSNFSAAIPSTSAAQTEYRVQRGYGLSGSRILGPNTISASASQTEDNANNLSSIANADAQAAGNFGDNLGTRSRNRLVTLQDVTALAKGIDITVGGEFQQQLAGASEFDPTFTNTALVTFARHVDSFWAGSTGRVGSQQWQVNVRRDQYSDFGGASTGLAGWGWSFASHWKLTAQVSSSFRAPGFVDLYYPGSGNPSLQAERAHAAEVGLRWSRAPFEASVTAFRNRVSDLIFTEPFYPYKAINVARAAMDGSEWAAGASAGAWRLAASLSLDHARQLEPTYADLARTAHYTARLSADYGQAPWTASAQIQRSGARNDTYFNPVTFAATPETLPAYNLARLALGYELRPGLRLLLRAENLLNAKYEVAYSYNTLPRLIIAGIDARL